MRGKLSMKCCSSAAVNGFFSSLSLDEDEHDEGGVVGRGGVDEDHNHFETIDCQLIGQ